MMTGPPKDSGTIRKSADMQLVVAPQNPMGSTVAKAGTSSGSIVEYGKGAGGGIVLREEEEDLEVKLRRIIENVPVRVNNTSGSSAGSGSGDFHQYRQMRRKEQDRLARMDVDYDRRKKLAEFNIRREERLKVAEDRTAKKRAKRQKKKIKRKEKKSKACGGEEEQQQQQQQLEWSSGSEDSDDPDADLNKQVF